MVVDLEADVTCRYDVFTIGLEANWPNVGGQQSAILAIFCNIFSEFYLGKFKRSRAISVT